MDLFEILLIAVFLVFPLIDQLLKGARGKGKLEPPESKGPPSSDRTGTPGSEREPVSAADMLPDDLWAVLTGERRDRSGGVGTTSPEPTVEATSEPAPWSEEEVDYGRAPWEETVEASPEPVSLEYAGPEAYSLEEVDFEAVSLERPLPTPEERHREFHELVDRSRPRRPRRSSALTRALADPGSVRRAVVLSEILGPPKALE